MEGTENGGQTPATSEQVVEPVTGVTRPKEDGDTPPPAPVYDEPVKEETVAQPQAVTPPTVNEEEPPETPVDRNKVNPCITIDREVHEPAKVNKNIGEFSMSFITRPIAEFDKVNQTAGGMLEELKSSREGREWLYHFSQGSDHYQAGGSFVKSLEREGSDWGQYVLYNGSRLAPGAPGIGGHGQKLSGAKAAAAMRAGMGLSNAITSPFWHSGLWLTITAPSDSELLILMHQIMDEKIVLGNATVGLAFSSNGVFTARKLVEFILPRIYSSTTLAMDPEDLMKLIKITDYQALLHMLGLTIYPHGFTYRRPCVSDLTKCEVVSEYHLNLSRTLLVDRSALSAEQKHFMSDRKTANTPETVLDYQKKGRSGMRRTVAVSENINVTFAVPSLFDWFESGSRWVRSVEETVERAFGDNLSIKQKNTYLTEQSVLTFLRQFSHWVAVIDDRGMEYDDPETIDAMIGVLSESEECMKNFIEELNKFIDDATHVVVAIPAHDCPACGKPQTVEGNPHPEAIPIDMQQILFSLADQRTQRARTKATQS